MNNTQGNTPDISRTKTLISRRGVIAAGCTLAATLAISAVLGPVARAEEAASDGQSDTVTIKSLNAAGETIDLEVPTNPQRVAILDLASLDIIDSLGEGDCVVGSASTSLDYLQKYVTDDAIANLGTIKEADLEAVFGCEPDIIFIGGRLAGSYDELSEIAPVVYLTTDTGKGVYQSTKDNAEQIAAIFGDEDKAAELFDGFDERIEKLRETAGGHTAVIGMATSGSFNVIGNGGRCSLITNEIGFENVGASVAADNSRQSGSSSGDAASGLTSSGGAEANPHGSESSFETVASLDPDYIFVLDRDSAIGTEGAQLAKDIMDNEIINSTRAAQDGHLVIMEHPAAWYTAEGGVTALGLMLDDLESALL